MQRVKLALACAALAACHVPATADAPDAPAADAAIATTPSIYDRVDRAQLAARLENNPHYDDTGDDTLAHIDLDLLTETARIQIAFQAQLAGIDP